MPLFFLHETCHSDRSEESRTSEEEFLSVLFLLKEKVPKISRRQFHDEPLPARVRFWENNYQKYIFKSQEFWGYLHIFFNLLG
jgi:hypothetical protein